jgi:hypothetical protein
MGLSGRIFSRQPSKAKCRQPKGNQNDLEDPERIWIAAWAHDESQQYGNNGNRNACRNGSHNLYSLNGLRGRFLCMPAILPHKKTPAEGPADFAMAARTTIQDNSGV